MQGHRNITSAMEEMSAFAAVDVSLANQIEYLTLHTLPYLTLPYPTLPTLKVGNEAQRPNNSIGS
jgi:hypothetical protein